MGRQALDKSFLFMNVFDFLCGPYGLMGLLGFCLVLLLYVRYLFGKKEAAFRNRAGLRRKTDLGGGSGGNVPDEDFVLDGYTQILGEAKAEPGVTVVSADEFGFYGQADEDQLGLLADAQQEIRELCQVLADKDGTKEDFFAMFALIREKYPRLAGHPLQASLEHFIREQVPFFLSVAELESLWD